MTGARLTRIADIAAYTFAGNAIFTLVSQATGGRFTLRVRSRDRVGGVRDFYFVDVLTGPENTHDYTFIGTVARTGEIIAPFRYSAKSTVAQDAPSVRAAMWFFRRLSAPNPDLEHAVEFYHSGDCARCGRLLTHPASIRTGLGPTCRDKLGR